MSATPTGETRACPASLHVRPTSCGWVASGLSNIEIAERLHLSTTTIKTHTGHLLSKLGLRDRVQLAIFAYESGLVRVGGT